VSLAVVFSLTLFSLFGIVASSLAAESSDYKSVEPEYQWSQDIGNKLAIPGEILGNFFSLFNESFNDARVLQSPANQIQI
jgi:hypothetical protein